MSALNTGHPVGFTLAEQADLAALNTFGVSARAGCLATLNETSALAGLLAEPAVAQMRQRFVLGGGSNVLFTGDFDGVVIRIASRGIETMEVSATHVRLRVAAGENWDSFVRWSLQQGLAGLENLIFIPGTVGAAPIQNIGAYGVELDEFVTRVEAWDFKHNTTSWLEAKDCGFAYRDSHFKREAGRYLVTSVELELPRKRELRLDYVGLRDELADMGITVPDHEAVARAVERLRRKKLPNPAEIGNAGSFFKNPVVNVSKAAVVQSECSALSAYPLGDERVKLAAAGLIEACGFKGWREGRVGVSDKHALVLVNHGGASGAEVWALAERIRGEVRARFGITLEPEPRLL